MLSLRTVPILLLIIVPTELLSVHQSEEGCRMAPSRSAFEEILGKPVECVGGTKHTCFRKDSISIRVLFDSFNRAETILVSEVCSGVRGPTELINRLVPKDGRGKLLKAPIHDSTSCSKSYVEEYECLTIQYSENNCMNCPTAGVDIKWK